MYQVQQAQATDMIGGKPIILGQAGSLLQGQIGNYCITDIIVLHLPLYIVFKSILCFVTSNSFPDRLPYF